jgi:hypothetical protein
MAVADEGLTVATVTPETGEGSSQTPPIDGPTETAEITQPAPVDPYVLSADIDIDELLRRNPKLQGKFGQAVQRGTNAEVQRLARERQAEDEAKMAQARLIEKRELARNNPDKLAQETLRELREEEVKTREQDLWKKFQKETGGQLEQQFNDFYLQPDVKSLWDSTDDATRRRLDWRNYDSVGQWNAVAADILADFKAEKLAEVRAKRMIEAAEKSSRVEAMAGEASEGVDLGLGGMVSGGRQFKLSEITPGHPNFMGREAWKKHASAIEYQVDNGLLIRD